MPDEPKWKKPKPGEPVEIRLESCWQQTRESDEELFYRLPLASLERVPKETPVIFPAMTGYAILPIEQYAEYLRHVDPDLLDDRLRFHRDQFLDWYRRKVMN